LAREPATDLRFRLAITARAVYFSAPAGNSEKHMLPDLTIIKAGTGVLTRTEDGTVDRAALVHLVAAISDLMNAGHRCLFVSSGAVGSGVSAMGLTEYPKDIVTRQACAAVGQARLMRTYTSLFGHFDISVAQILLTAGDINTPKRAGYIMSTLTRLLEEPRIIPIINENDSVAIRELNFGDNDMLCVRVAKLIGAKRIVLLTSVDGLLDPETNELVREVGDIDSVFSHVREDKGKFSMGGMSSKLKAVKFAVEAGIETHIANGRRPRRLVDIVEGKGLSTKFIPDT
jgi:glutamate 5-kinase